MPHFWQWIADILGLGELNAPADKISLLVAFVTGLGSAGTVVAIIFAALSARAAARAANEAAHQLQVSVEQLRAQAFADVMVYEREIDLSKKMDAIRRYQNTNIKYEDLSTLQHREIREVADFFNHIAHFMRNRYILPRQLLMIYWWSLDDCNRILIERLRWLEHFRERWGEGYYSQFENICLPEWRERVWRWQDNPELRAWFDDPNAINPPVALGPRAALSNEL
jgi:hypothetical protein